MTAVDSGLSNRDRDRRHLAHLTRLRRCGAHLQAPSVRACAADRRSRWHRHEREAREADVHAEEPGRRSLPRRPTRQDAPRVRGPHARRFRHRPSTVRLPHTPRARHARSRAWKADRDQRSRGAHRGSHLQRIRERSRHERDRPGVEPRGHTFAAYRHASSLVRMVRRHNPPDAPQRALYRCVAFQRNAVGQGAGYESPPPAKTTGERDDGARAA